MHSFVWNILIIGSFCTKWAPTILINGVISLYKWPYKWVIGVITPYKWSSYNLRTFPITGKGPPCNFVVDFSCNNWNSPVWKLIHFQGWCFRSRFPLYDAPVAYRAKKLLFCIQDETCPNENLQNLPSYNAVFFVTSQQSLPIVFVSLLYIFYTDYSEKKKHSQPPSQEVLRIFEPNKYIQRESNGALLLLKRTDMVVKKALPKKSLADHEKNGSAGSGDEINPE